MVWCHPRNSRLELGGNSRITIRIQSSWIQIMIRIQECFYKNIFFRLRLGRVGRGQRNNLLDFDGNPNRDPNIYLYQLSVVDDLLYIVLGSNSPLNQNFTRRRRSTGQHKHYVVDYFVIIDYAIYDRCD